MSAVRFKVARAGMDGITGKARPGAQIELIDLSNAPKGRLHSEDTFVAGKANSKGEFKAALDTRVGEPASGNLLRLRAVYKDGTHSRWRDVWLDPDGIDTTNVFVATSRLEPALDGGKIQIINNNSARPLSEPFAQLRFTNTRTGKSVGVTLDGYGQFPRGRVVIAGEPGDVLRIAASDGENNRDFRVAAGELVVPGLEETNTGGTDVPDPTLTKDDMSKRGVAKYATRRFKIDWDLPEDFATRIYQGNIGNCFFPAAVAAIADASLDILRNMAKVNDDQTITFRFHIDGEPKTVTIDGDLYVRANGQLLYGRDIHFALLEKAYAIARGGSYEILGQGGNSGVVIADLTGRDLVFEFTDEHTEESLWRIIKKAVRTQSPASFSTHGPEEKSRYKNSGVYANHGYSVFGCREVKKGNKTERLVTVRNPWGESEPTGNGPNDGIFELPVKQAMHYFDMFHTVA